MRGAQSYIHTCYVVTNPERIRRAHIKTFLSTSYTLDTFTMNSKTNKVAAAFLLSSASSSLSVDAFSPTLSFKVSQPKATSTTTTVACQKDSSSDAEKSRRTFISNFSGVSAMYCGVISSNYVTNKVSSESQECGCKGMVHVCGAGFSRPMNANAFYERDVGGDNPSPETAAFNIQVCVM